MFILILGWVMLIGGLIEFFSWFKNSKLRATKIKVFGTLVFIALLSFVHAPDNWIDLPILVILSAFSTAIIEFILRKAKKYAGANFK